MKKSLIRAPTKEVAPMQRHQMALQKIVTSDSSRTLFVIGELIH